jgi:pentatricopeptide repeat protein
VGLLGLGPRPSNTIILREMDSKERLKPGLITFNAVIGKLCELDKMKGVNDMLNEMRWMREG